MQSPIDLNMENATKLLWLQKISMMMDSNASMKYVMTPTKWKLECNVPWTCGNITVGCEIRYLRSVDIYHQSEHTLGGIKYPMELHAVYDATPMISLSVLYEVGNSAPELDSFINVTLAAGSGGVNLTGMFGDSIKSDYLMMYDGSLTAPPCTEGVRWLVSNKTRQLSQVQMDTLIEFQGGKRTDRPLQSLNGRSFYAF